MVWNEHIFDFRAYESKSLPNFGVMMSVNASMFVIKVAANIRTHFLHPTLCDNESVLTEETFKAGKRAGRWGELTDYHCAEFTRMALSTILSTDGIFWAVIERR